MWFTLIEVLVVISIIAILVVWIARLDFNRLSGKQKVEIFWNKIVSNIETIMTNALLWKWVWEKLYTPDEWKIEISEAGSWKLITSYLSWSSRIYHSIDSMDNITYPYSISNIECKDLVFPYSTWALSSSTWTIIINQGNLSLSGCQDTGYRIIKFDALYLDNKRTIELNAINAVIE